MMRIFSRTKLLEGRRGRRWDAWRARVEARLRSGARGEDGFLLIEVIVSSMMVAIIVIGTLNGFDVESRVTEFDRNHDEAIVLASESQSELRSDPASVLAQIAAAAHTYKRTVGGTVYTVTQGAELQPASGAKAACSATEKNRQSGDAYRVTSTVSWPVQLVEKSPTVVASSIATPPIGSDLEIDAESGPAELGGVPGVTAKATYIPEEGSSTSQEQTTNSEGCALFGDIPSTAAKLEVESKSGWVTPSGKNELEPAELTLAPNYTTHYSVIYNQAGAIKAEYTYNNKTQIEVNSNNEKEKVKLNVASDTFVAGNAGMNQSPNFEVGGVEFGPGTPPLYEPLPGKETNAGYAATAVTPTDLFPFPAAEKSYWTVYAGDCGENNPETVTGGSVKLEGEQVVKPGETTTVKVPTSYTTLNLYGPTKKESEITALGASERYPYLETANSYPAMIDNLKCAATTPDNETTVNYKHLQATSTGSASGGHLSFPFQPFGKEFTLCLVDSALERTYKVKYANTSTSGGNFSIFLHQRPASEVSGERASKEAEYKAKETEYKAKEKASETKITEYKSRESEYKAKETPYKNKESEFKTKEAAYNAKAAAVASKKGEYESDKTTYEKYESEYKSKETYKTRETEYKSKETAYKTKETEYKSKETAYKTKESEYEKYKKEYEKTKNGTYKTDYEQDLTAETTDKKEFEKLKSEFEKLKGEYETLKSEYEKLKGEYETAKKAYETWKTEYGNDKKEYETLSSEATTLATSYKQLESEYTKLYGEYTKLKGEYETDKSESISDANESVTDKSEFESDKKAYEAAKVEEKEGASVTVTKGTVCT
jgi:Tfp pilus assembly protein PilV/predicted  nucleic acid-binding Zn-ribbon protein